MCQHMRFCHREVSRKEEQEKREKSLAKFCMNHTHEVRERAYFRPVCEISIVGAIVGAYGISFVGHLQLGRVNSQMATQQGEGAISKEKGACRKAELPSPLLVTEALTLY